MSNVLELAGRARLPSVLVWRGVAKAGGAVGGSHPNVVVSAAGGGSRSAAGTHGRAISCRGGFYASARGGKVLPWHAGNSAPALRKRGEWENGVLGMNLGMSGVEGAVVVQAIITILVAGLGVAVTCLAVFMLGSHAFSGSPAAKPAQVYGMEEPVAQVQAVASSYQVAGVAVGDWLASAGSAYRASVSSPAGGSSILGFIGTGGHSSGLSRE